MKEQRSKNNNIILIYPKTGVDVEGINIQLPMGLLNVAAPLVKKGYKVKILDQRVEKRFFKKLKRLLEKSPVCVGMSTMTGTQILYALKVSRFIRKNDSTIPIVWGGIHPTLMPEQVLRNENIDIVVRGEGEITFCELVSALQSKGKFENIAGLSWKKENKINHNNKREFINLDNYPEMPYELLNVEKYILPQIPGRKRSLDIYTSRGCPGECTFCYNKSFNRSKYRGKNIDLVIKEIRFLVKKYDLDSFYINDDNFFTDIRRGHYFCEQLIEKKIVQEWGCQGVRIDSLEKVDLSKLEKSGCKHLYIGIESGSEEILRSIKKQITIAQIKKIVKKLANSKIIAHYNFMIGYPDEDLDRLNDTIELVDHIMRTDSKAYFSSFHLITPYPGTELFNLMQKDGYKFPTKLEGWANLRWEAENAYWIPSEIRNIAINITLLTYFIDNKVLEKTRHNFFKKNLTKLLIILAKYRWKNRKFTYCPELRILNKTINYINTIKAYPKLKAGRKTEINN